MDAPAPALPPVPLQPVDAVEVTILVDGDSGTMVRAFGRSVVKLLTIGPRQRETPMTQPNVETLCRVLHQRG